MKDSDTSKRSPSNFRGLPDDEAVRPIIETRANAENDEQWARSAQAPVVGVLASLNVGKPKPLERRGRPIPSAIFKTPVEVAVRLSETGLEGDEQADLRVHGGPDKVVCAYCVENLPYWSKVLGNCLAPGAFGENFSVEGMMEPDVYIGDVHEVGDAVVQVSQPRQPCFKLAARHGLPEMALLVQESGKKGFYFRCLDAGEVRRGDEISLVERPAGAVSVAEANRVMHRDKADRAAAERLLEAPGLSASWRKSLERRLSGDAESQAARLEGDG